MKKQRLRIKDIRALAVEARDLALAKAEGMSATERFRFLEELETLVGGLRMDCEDAMFDSAYGPSESRP